MKVNIEIVLAIETNVGSTRGSFPVNQRSFKLDPDWTVGIIAYEWIQRLWRECGCREYQVLSVKWNEENDITELVKEIQPAVIDPLPF